MFRAKSQVQKFIIQMLIPVACSVALGFILHQGEVFDYRSSSFQFVWSAVVASILYYLLVFVRTRDALIAFIVLLLVTILTMGSTRIVFIVRDLFYVGAIGLTVYLYHRHFERRAAEQFIHPAFMLAGIYAVLNTVVSELHLAILEAFGLEHSGVTFVALARVTTYFGALIGFAFGLGISIAELLLGKGRTAQSGSP